MTRKVFDMDDYDNDKYMPKYVTMQVVDIKKLYNNICDVTAASLERDIVLKFIAGREDIDKGYEFHITFDWD